MAFELTTVLDVTDLAADKAKTLLKDKGFEDGALRVFVDEESRPLLAGARVDYIDDVMKQGFSINNPNAVSSCACGTSFDTADKAGASQARSCC